MAEAPTKSKPSTELVSQPGHGKLLAKLAEKYGVNQRSLLDTVKSTLIKDKRTPVTDEQLIAFLIVANRYNLDPFTNEIYAFPKDGGIIPIVGIDGFTAIANSDKNYDGFVIEWSEKTTKLAGAKECPEWAEIHIHRKDRTNPVVVREYLDEVYVAPRGNFSGPWQSHTKRMLRHKVMIQGFRVAFGISGIYDEDEAHRIIDVTTQTPVTDKPLVELKNGKTAEPAAGAQAEDAKPRPSALDIKIHEAKAKLTELMPNIRAGEKQTLGEEFYYNTLGSEFGAEHMTELPEGKKEMFLSLLSQKIKDIESDRT